MEALLLMRYLWSIKEKTITREQGEHAQKPQYVFSYMGKTERALAVSGVVCTNMREE